MKNVLDVIAEKKAALPRKQRIVAEYMEQNPQLMSYITLKELSNDLQVTEITVLKTCQSLGYGGFNDIKYEFRKTAIEKEKRMFWMKKTPIRKRFRHTNQKMKESF